MYGAAVPAVSAGYSGFVLLEDASDLDTAPSCSTDYVQGDGPATYTTSCSGGASANYAFVYVDGTFTVGKATLTVTASSPANGVYGAAVPAVSAGYSGFVLLEDASDLDTAPSCSTDYVQGDGPGHVHHQLLGRRVRQLRVRLRRRHVHRRQGHPHGHRLEPGQRRVRRGRAGGQRGLQRLRPARGRVRPRHRAQLLDRLRPGHGPATYTTSCSGGVSANYAFVYVDGTFTVGKATLTVTASSPANGVYGAAVPAVSAGYSGFVLLEDASDLDTAPSCSTDYVQGDGPATYTTSCSGGVSANYAFVYVDGTFTVGKATLTATASSPANGVYGAAVPAVSAGYSGFVLLEDASEDDEPVMATTAPASSIFFRGFPDLCSWAAACAWLASARHSGRQRLNP